MSRMKKGLERGSKKTSIEELLSSFERIQGYKIVLRGGKYGALLFGLENLDCALRAIKSRSREASFLKYDKHQKRTLTKWKPILDADPLRFRIETPEGALPYNVWHWINSHPKPIEVYAETPRLSFTVVCPDRETAMLFKLSCC